jgi:hypothetical protein
MRAAALQAALVNVADEEVGAALVAALTDLAQQLLDRDAGLFGPRSPHHLRRHHPRPRRTDHPPRPLTAPRRNQALAALCDQLTQARARYPGTGLVLRYDVKPHPGTA